jgi:subtilase family serine protease
MEYTVANAGTAATGDFQIVLHYPNGSIATAFWTGGLARGASRTFRYMPGEGGCEYTLTIRVDVTDAVRESNESNNQRVFNRIC